MTLKVTQDHKKNFGIEWLMCWWAIKELLTHSLIENHLSLPIIGLYYVASNDLPTVSYILSCLHYVSAI